MTPLTPRAVKDCINNLSLMVYFPAEASARTALFEALRRMITYNEEAEWLAYRANQVFTTWPGIRELRALFCKRFQPKDGVEVDSQNFPNGFPSEAELGQVPVAGLPAARTELETVPLLAGVPNDPELMAIVSTLVKSAGRIDVESGCPDEEMKQQNANAKG